MKKTFRFLALSFALICGTLSSFAQPANGPAIGTKVGNTIDLGVVVYEVAAWDPSIKDASGEVVGAYLVDITGLNWTGLQTKPNELTIKLAFDEMYGKVMCKYVVRKIIDTDKDHKEAFWAQTNLTKLEFVNDLTVIKDPYPFTIGAYSFYGTNKLKDLIFPDNVTSIGKYAFQDCGVVNFEIPAGCVSIDQYAFYNTKQLETVTVREAKEGEGGALTTLKAKLFANSHLQNLDLSKAYQLTTIGEGIDESPFLYNKSVVNNQLATVTLPAAKSPATTSLLADVYNSFRDCTNLKSIKNLDISIIDDFPDDAFRNCEKLIGLDFPCGVYGTTMLTGSPFAGCSSLISLTFAADFWGTIGDGFNNLFAETLDAPSATDALLNITFKGYLNGTIKGYAFGDDDYAANGGDVCTSLAALTITKGLQAGTYNNGADNPFGATIEQYAFGYCDALETVSLNGVTIGGGNKAADDVTIADQAFYATGIKTLNLGNIAITNNEAARTFALGSNVFTGSALESVEIGTITISSNTTTPFNHVVSFANSFVGGANFTTFKAGAIDNNFGTVTFGDGASRVASSNGFWGAWNDALETVTFANITTSSAVTFEDYAFRSDALATVTFGDFTKKDAANNTAELIKISDGAFSNGLYTSVAKTITIGNIAANTTIEGGAFTGGQDATSYTATLGNIKKANASNKDFTLTIGAAAFGGPSEGAVSYTIGEISSGVSGIAAGAFEGTDDANGDANTTVNIGDYKKELPNWYTFTDVKDLTIKSYGNCYGVTKIGAPVTLTITNDVTGYLYGDDGDNTITEVTFGGNITKAESIDKFGKEVRKIEFAKDKEVVVDAVASNAFEPASTDADTNGEVINVIYRCSDGNEVAYNAIFKEDAFGDASIDEAVVLFTTVWAQDNIFLNKEFYANGVYRMTMSASTVAPGDDIEATLIAGKNGINKYGKLYIPKGIGMTYKIDAKVSGSKNGVNVFSAHLDQDNIYMKQLDTYMGSYWIDATDENQVFIVRTNDMTANTVEAKYADPAEQPDPRYWFNAYDAAKNFLEFTPNEIVNTELQNNAEFKHQTIYVMANPAKYNLAFVKLNQYESSKNMPKNSIYIVSPTDPQASAARLNVIFEDEIDNVDNATGIQFIEAEETANSNAIYNLQGVRVNNAKKGVFIINGKKVIK